ncbi:hypothetical protein [Bdellovibrio reynosensis]|uniref:Uncharacterized protein n=1 Tax=Bdellovibrio reynosensis TaxID=2835041 RepID=A0ABY4C532_9BACT|nr:hypothetical protein [Bdellovibrio reynosensis]UOF00072.1 hypothetical protein MNR06_10200 [Bdellovibrio reynosensis]
MKSLKNPLLIFVFAATSFAVAAPPMESSEYIAPAEPYSVLRGSMVPCYGNREKGAGRNIYLRHLEGEECPKRVATPVRKDKPEDESVSPGIPFQQKTNL